MEPGATGSAPPPTPEGPVAAERPVSEQPAAPPPDPVPAAATPVASLAPPLAPVEPREATPSRPLLALLAFGLVLLGVLGCFWRHPVWGPSEIVVLPAPECPGFHEVGFGYMFNLGRTRAADLSDDDWDPVRSPVLVLEDDKPLRPHAPHATIRTEGHGTFSVWDGNLLLSATDNSDPTSNGHRYRVVVDGEQASHNGADLAPRWIWWLVVAWHLGVACALATRYRFVPLLTYQRALLVALALLFGIHVADRWDICVVQPDSHSYSEGWSTKKLRPPVYPLFVALTSGADASARGADSSVYDPRAERAHPALVGAARAQRAFLLGSLLVFAAVLMREVSPPLVALLCLKLLRSGWLTSDADAIMSEALAQAWMFLLAAAVVVHARSGRDAVWLPVIALVVALLVLTRPAGLYGVALLGCAVGFAFFLRGRKAAKGALAAVGVLVGVLALPSVERVLVEGSGGASMVPTARICFALEVADPSDVERMPDETSRRFLTAALERMPGKHAEIPKGRAPADVWEWEYLAPNLYGVAFPLAREMKLDDIEACALFDRVSFAILPAHPARLARLYNESFWYGWRTSRVNPFSVVSEPRLRTVGGFLVVLALAACWYFADARMRYLSVAFLVAHAAALAVIAVGDAPITRYVFATEPLVLAGAFVLVVSSVERAATLWWPGPGGA